MSQIPNNSLTPAPPPHPPTPPLMSYYADNFMIALALKAYAVNGDVKGAQV